MPATIFRYKYTQVMPTQKLIQEAHLKSEAWIILDTTPQGQIYVGLKKGTTEASPSCFN